MLSLEQQKFLIFLARRAVEYSFQKGGKLQLAQKAIPFPELLEKQGCFVSLHTISGQLRGCIGHILPQEFLYQAVIDNALAASFQDPRFEMLAPTELDEVIFEVSVLSVPQNYQYSNPQQLLTFLEQEKPGVVLSLGQDRATYLPQVWQDLLDPQEFLSSLCQKAGLTSSAWQEAGVTIQTYQAQVFAESAPGYFP